jgi:transcription elongation factor GreA
MKNNKEKIQITAKGLEELKKELEFRKNVKKKEINEVIRSAIEEGDLSENDEYSLALEDSLVNNARIDELMELIKNAKVVKNCKDIKKICIGHKVTLKSQDNKELVVSIVGETEANPLKKLVSSTSPMGSALIGRSMNDNVKIKTPAGETEYKILKIELL